MIYTPAEIAQRLEKFALELRGQTADKRRKVLTAERAEDIALLLHGWAGSLSAWARSQP